MWPVKFKGDAFIPTAQEFQAQRQAMQLALRKSIQKTAPGMEVSFESQTLVRVKAHATLARWSPIGIQGGPMFTFAGAGFPKGMEERTAIQGAALENRKPWGILAEPVAANKFAWVIVKGIALANVTIDNTARPNIGCDCETGQAALVVKEGGPARILYRQAGTGLRPCIIDISPTTPRFFVGTNAAGSIAPGFFGLITATGDTSFIVWAKNESPTGTVAASAKVGCTWDDLQRSYVITLEFCED
jgi:hypothetical protein